MRWMKFNAVGALGMVVQLVAFGFLVHVLGLHYLLATALAVEAAVLHNFVWHIRWTWADRRGTAGSSPALLLLRFNLTTGAVSIAGNVLAMRILSGSIGLDPVAANLISILLCAFFNFLVCDRFVFSFRSAAEPPKISHRGTEPQRNSFSNNQRLRSCRTGIRGTQASQME